MVNTGKLKVALVAALFCAATGFGLTACNKGTEPGDTNVERSEIIETEEDVDKSLGTMDTSDYEHLYDHADHPDSTALGSGAYDQDGDRDKRP